MSENGCGQADSMAKRFIVITGGPGAGKTALLEMIRRSFCQHLAILPESAGILYQGGFPRTPTLGARVPTQRAIFYVQHELENCAKAIYSAPVILCDRGSLDGLAYWPKPWGDFFEEVGSSKPKEFDRYYAIIHLRTPTLAEGYNHQNPLRIESAEEAHSIDEKILKAWEGHPRRHVVAGTADFTNKVLRTLQIIRDDLMIPCEHSKSLGQFRL